MMRVTDVVVLVEDLPEQGLLAGMQGTVVEVFHDPRRAYEVEFLDGQGDTVGIATLRPEQVELDAAT